MSDKNLNEMEKLIARHNLSNERIEQGDRVRIYYSAYLGDYEGIVLWIPSGEGDMWHIKDDNGVIHAVNPSSSALCEIRLVKRYE